VHGGSNAPSRGEGGRGPGLVAPDPRSSSRPNPHQAPSLGWALRNGCGQRFISKALDEDCAVHGGSNAPSRGEGGRGPGLVAPDPRSSNRTETHKAPALGWALCKACGQRFISKAPDEGCAAHDGTKAPSRWGGRARAGGWSPRPEKLKPNRDAQSALPRVGAAQGLWLAVYLESPGRGVCGA
jgi:hypothetical protein